MTKIYFTRLIWFEWHLTFFFISLSVALSLSHFNFSIRKDIHSAAFYRWFASIAVSMLSFVQRKEKIPILFSHAISHTIHLLNINQPEFKYRQYTHSCSHKYRNTYHSAISMNRIGFSVWAAANRAIPGTYICCATSIA